MPGLGFTFEISATDQDDLHDQIVAFARRLPDPDMIAAIRLDDWAGVAELDIDPAGLDTACAAWNDGTLRVRWLAPRFAPRPADHAAPRVLH